MTVHFVTGPDMLDRVDAITREAVESGQGYRVTVKRDASGAREAVVTVFDEVESDA